MNTQKLFLRVAITGCIVALLCGVALYIAGYLADEGKLDPGVGSVPLMIGFAAGILAGAGGFITWAIRMPPLKP